MEPWSRIIENSFSGSCWGLWAKRTMGPSIPSVKGHLGLSQTGAQWLPVAQCILQVNQGRNMGKSVNQEIMGHPYQGHPYHFLLSTSHYIHILPGCSVVGLIPSSTMWDSPVIVTIPRWPKWWAYDRDHIHCCNQLLDMAVLLNRMQIFTLRWQLGHTKRRVEMSWRHEQCFVRGLAGKSMTCSLFQVSVFLMWHTGTTVWFSLIQ